MCFGCYIPIESSLPLLCYLSYNVPNIRGSVLGDDAVEYVRASNTVRKPEFFILARNVSARREISNILPLHQIIPVECSFIPCQTGASQKERCLKLEGIIRI